MNVLAACDFDLNFVTVYAGFEGSAHDSWVLARVKSIGIFEIPPGTSLLGDTGYVCQVPFLGTWSAVAEELRETLRREKEEREERQPNAEEEEPEVGDLRAPEDMKRLREAFTRELWRQYQGSRRHRGRPSRRRYDEDED
ncbi:hypothetical protein B9479_003993 [Cryptococcus floricola]|uniref:DDE Tnp4 domain-containing protein n=1 Tax=Cryptococcus floricola TaxID=2591691 RepID=A0A5D3AXH8_9TREE|nr:hypothetical protein B9479_003993 [Cryptococcus floricola]